MDSIERVSQAETLRPLAGVRVLDMTRYVAGPYCTMLLADHGAEVIKVEPLGGDETRAIPPKLGHIDGGVSIYFARFGRNKKSVCVDLKSEEGRRVFSDLVRNADVLVENFRAGVLERLGFSSERLLELNERLIYCSISGFGHAPSPYRDRPAFAPVVEGLSGAVRFHPPDNDPPLTLGISMGDMFPGVLSVSAITMALIEREETGRGQHIDMAMYDAVLSLNERWLCFTAMTGADLTPGKPALTSTPSGIQRVKDGHISLAVVGEHIWKRFCKTIGHEELLQDPRLGSGPARAEVYGEVLEPVIAPWMAARTRAEAVLALREGGVPCGEVMGPFEVLEDEQVRVRDMISHVPSYAGTEVKVAANPIPLDPGPRRLDPIPAPGEHTVEVLHDVLGYDGSRVQELLDGGAVGAWAVPEPVPA
jgi:crotonobetainyl-CoA:carnitine CoA-transferase CaiB-like acyl-CoA transferase